MALSPMLSFEHCPANTTEAMAFLESHASRRGIMTLTTKERTKARNQWGADSDATVDAFPCLDAATGRLSLPLRLGDPPERQSSCEARLDQRPGLPSRVCEPRLGHVDTVRG